VSFELFARLLLSGEPRGEERIVAAGASWSLDPRVLAEADVIVWGQPPDARALGPGSLRSAYLREAALRSLSRRPPPPLRLTGVHRWRPGFYRAAALTPLARWVRAGAVVELSRQARPPRLVDLAARAAGAQGRPMALRPGAGGAALVPVTLPGRGDWMLRLAHADAPGQPSRTADALERLQGIGGGRIPLPGERGVTARVSWTLESLLPGRVPARLTPRLAREAVELCVRLPHSSGAPTAQRDDLEAVARRLPDRSGEVLRMARELDRVVAELPAVGRHGDLWTGNLLAQRGRLTGVVDWDAWHPSAVPGTDLLQLWTGEHVARGRSLGQAWYERPWLARRPRELSRPYWRALGLDPDGDVISAVGLAWWASQVATSLERSPELAVDERWVERSVDVVLDASDVTSR
jgi:hypothetical protein